MRLFREVVVFAISSLLLVPALPARAQSNQGRPDIQLQGVVIAVDPAGNGFVLRRPRQPDSRAWKIQTTDDTDVQLTDALADEDDVDDPEVAIGDFVTVIGQRTGSRQMLAKTVTIFGHGQATTPAPVHPMLAAPQLFAPSNGETITGSQILIVGRTVPGARVHVDLGVEGNRSLTTSADTQADANGIFSVKVGLPWRGLRGSYRLTATSSLNGQVSTPTSVVVRLN